MSSMPMLNTNPDRCTVYNKNINKQKNIYLYLSSTGHLAYKLMHRLILNLGLITVAPVRQTVTVDLRMNITHTSPNHQRDEHVKNL